MNNMTMKHATNIDPVIRVLRELGLGISSLNQNEYLSITPLHRAVILQQNDIMMDYISPDTVNVQDEKGRTPLFFAVELGDITAVKNLLNGKANPSIPESSSKTGRGFSPLHVAARNGNVEIMKALLTSSATPSDMANAMSNNLGSPLHLACRSLSWDAALFLTTIPGIDPSLKDSNGNTPLHIAMALMLTTDSSQVDEILKALLAIGADINAKNNKGRTPLHLAAEMGRTLTVSKLCTTHGINIEALDSQELTPLHLAASCAHPIIDTKKSVIQVLVEAGANVNAKDMNGMTPVERAKELLQSRTWNAKEESMLQDEIKRLESTSSPTKNQPTI